MIPYRDPWTLQSKSEGTYCATERKGARAVPNRSRPSVVPEGLLDLNLESLKQYVHRERPQLEQQTSAIRTSLTRPSAPDH